jgi:hypothetical protein
MTLPNFLVIGAGKAGTTSVYRYLKQHPQVFMSPIKETNFFAYTCAGWDDRELNRLGWSARFPVRTLEAYETLFEPVRDEKAVGEISPRYLSVGRPAAECIRRHLPGVRLIAILRNPIERAFSSYLFHTRDGRERRTFERAIGEERAGVQPEKMDFGQLHYVGLGRYCDLLEPYFDLFPREQIQVHLFADLQRDPAALMRKHLPLPGDRRGVRPRFEPALQRLGDPEERPSPAAIAGPTDHVSRATHAAEPPPGRGGRAHRVPAHAWAREAGDANRDTA